MERRAPTWALAPLLALAACPSLGELRVGSGADAGSDGTAPPPDVYRPDVRPDRTIREAGVDSASCDASLGSDMRNCGRCGHDCLGGACSAGICQPIVLYEGNDTPSSLVVNGSDLYVTVQKQVPDSSSGYVFRCNVDDCSGTRTILASGLTDPWFAVQQGTTLYWANSGDEDSGAITISGNVASCPEKGCPDGGPVAYLPEGGGAEGGVTIGGLAADATYLYWSVTFDGTSLFSGAIYRCAIADCPGTLVQLFAGDLSVPFAVALDSHSVYWTDFGMSQILRCALPCNGGPTILAMNQPNAAGLALFGGHTYWTQGVNDGGVLDCPSTGCGASPNVIAGGQASPLAVAVDDSGVYWTNSTTGTLMRCPSSGCKTPTPMAVAPAAFAIALDPVSVYFTDSSAFGRVLRVAK